MTPRFRLTIMNPNERIFGNGDWGQFQDQARFENERGEPVVFLRDAKICGVSRSVVTLSGYERVQDDLFRQQTWRLDYLDSLPPPPVTDGAQSESPPANP